MHRVAAIASRGQWPADEADATATLDYDTRCRRRIRIDTDAGEPVLLERAQAGVLADGDGLKLDDERWVLVHARPEALLSVNAANERARLRLAWHLGNRHLPTEIDGETLLIRRDHVIEAMLRGLGADVQSVMRPFNPEGGAYHGDGDGHVNGHGNGHAHDHGHDHLQPGVGEPSPSEHVPIGARPNGKDHGR
jgi:urease accessory protein